MTEHETLDRHDKVIRRLKKANVAKLAAQCNARSKRAEDGERR